MQRNFEKAGKFRSFFRTITIVNWKEGQVRYWTLYLGKKSFLGVEISKFWTIIVVNFMFWTIYSCQFWNVMILWYIDPQRLNLNAIYRKLTTMIVQDFVIMMILSVFKMCWFGFFWKSVAFVFPQKPLSKGNFLLRYQHIFLM